MNDAPAMQLVCQYSLGFRVAGTSARSLVVDLVEELQRGRDPVDPDLGEHEPEARVAVEDRRPG